MPDNAMVSDNAMPSPWSVRIARGEVPESGRHLDLVADAPLRAAIAKLAGLTDVPRLEASFDVTPRGRHGLRVVGAVSATVGQICGVTLEPIENEVDEPIDLVFKPEAVAPARKSFPAQPEVPVDVEISVDDGPELLVGDAVDLGAIATEFLMLGIDPYPRKSGVVFEASAAGDDSARPFAALAALAPEAKKMRAKTTGAKKDRAKTGPGEG
jgi:hypothetical protein